MKKTIHLLLAGLFLPLCSFGNTSMNEEGEGCGILCNPDFENTTPAISTASIIDQSQVNCWQTTASDGKIEVWGTGNPHGYAPYSGSQFIELNATQAATVYQDFTVTGGSSLVVSFAHRGRWGIDQMEVEIGPVGGPYTSLGVFSDDETSWKYYSANYVVPSGVGTNFTLRFKSIAWHGGPQFHEMGNLLDAVSLCFGEVGTEWRGCESCALADVDLTNFVIDASGNTQADFYLNSGPKVIKKMRVTVISFSYSALTPSCQPVPPSMSSGPITNVSTPVSGFPYTFAPSNPGVSPGFTNQVEMITTSPQNIIDNFGLTLYFPPVTVSGPPGGPNCTIYLNVCFRVELIDENCVVCEHVVCAMVPAPKSDEDQGLRTINSTDESNQLLNVYPNPSDGSFTINTEKIGEGCQYELLSTDGRQVKTGTVEGTLLMIDGARLSPGTYTLLVSKGAATFTEKIIVVK